MFNHVNAHAERQIEPGVGTEAIFAGILTTRHIC